MWKVLTFNKSAVKDAFLTQGVEPAATDTLVATARPPLPGLEYTLKGQEQTTHFTKDFFKRVELMKICPPEDEHNSVRNI